MAQVVWPTNWPGYWIDGRILDVIGLGHDCGALTVETDTEKGTVRVWAWWEGRIADL